jgi:NAD(P)H-dependent FMN reductase
MNWIIVSGSHRKKSQSEKIAIFIQEITKKNFPEISCEIISLGGNPIPLWDESIWNSAPEWERLWRPYRSKLQAAHGFVFVVPEWGGMVPPSFKNFLLLCSPQELGHKPALIVGVSSSKNGAYPISELRMSGYKNNYVCYLPEHIIIRNAESVFNTDSLANDEEVYLYKRIQYELQILKQYTTALKSVRESGVLNFKDYPFGM